MSKVRKSPRKFSKGAPTKVSKKRIEQKRQVKASIDDKEKLFNESLISAVCVRSVIYDRDHPDHGRKKLASRAWNVISKEVDGPVSTCHTRWRSLKDTFNRKSSDWQTNRSGDGLHDESIKPSWPWFDTLMFLKDCNIPGKAVDTLHFS
ncbi:unnamed protein product [Allacma fusca]|uniref:MADF domain-containing protein n=1 Tax=Allacma fusca TaxID=39272 RepID=A0A8J2PG06_9HEXA|nr:unnamed protein product [Allacma fusca]